MKLDKPMDIPEVERPGLFESHGSIYVVKPTKDKQRLYALRMVTISGKRLTESGATVKAEFEYEQGAIYRLREDERMSTERAKELTLLYGHCLVCGRLLKDAKSVETGIGPICRKYLR